MRHTAVVFGKRLGVFACVVALGLLAGCRSAAPAAPIAEDRPQSERQRSSALRPASREIVIGDSVEGQPIVMLVFGSLPAARETVLVLGGIHGNEPTSVDVAEGLIELLRERSALYADRTIAVIPCLNPDGTARGTRGNARGVDLNRNFPATNWQAGPRQNRRFGSRPASEPETRALLSVLAELRPARIMSIHSIPRHRRCNNYDGPAAELAAAMSRCNGYPPTATMGYPTPGSLGTWAGVDRGIPIITLELPRDQPGPAAWRDNREAVLTFIEWPRRDGPIHAR